MKEGITMKRTLFVLLTLLLLFVSGTAVMADGSSGAEPFFTENSLIGSTLHFETSDVDGNTVSSEDIFKENEITMIHIWATRCGSCKREMAELAEMDHRLADKNAAVIGICMDADTELETCRDLLEEHEVDYLNLLPYEGIENDLEIPCFPVSYFADSEGKIVSVFADPVHVTDDGIYRVTVLDAGGDPVEDVMVQFCSDTECMMGSTDENGTAEFEADEGIYQVHILTVPEGYEGTDTVYETAETYCDVCVALQKTV